MLNITKTLENGALTIALAGELNTFTSQELKKVIDESIDSASSVTFDLENLEYISSAGLRLFLTTQQTMDERALPTVAVKNASAVILETFAITGFNNVLEVL